MTSRHHIAMIASYTLIVTRNVRIIYNQFGIFTLLAKFLSCKKSHSHNSRSILFMTNCTWSKWVVLQKTAATATHRFTLPQLLLCTVKVKVDVQALEKLGDWIAVCIRLLTQKRHTTLSQRIIHHSLSTLQERCFLTANS